MASPLPLVPMPSRVETTSDQYLITSRTTFSYPDALEGVAVRFAEEFRAATGITLRRAKEGAIRLELNPGMSSLGVEGYLLVSTANGVIITGAAANGVFYGLQTLKQLLPPEVYGSKPVRGASWPVPGVRIEDVPRFSWRGAMLDVARHYRTVDFVKRFIDLLAMHKMNTFHWHLTEDQGWRLEIKKWPKLTEVGAWRKHTIIGRPDGDPKTWKFDGEKHGGFYTQEEAREVVRYAAERFITVVPEIEMPGHAQAAVASYPQFGAAKTPQEVLTWWGVSENIFNVREETFRFLFDVLEETLDIFPSKFIHVGGDEVPKKQWKEDAYAQEVMKKEGLKNEEELQSWFIKRIDAFLDGKGRRLIGWDEILEGGLAEGATVMSWRGMDGGIHAAKEGHDVVMAPTSHTYLDYYQSRNTQTEPMAIGGYLPLKTVYGFEPVPPQLEDSRRHHILGTQGQLWSEYLRDERKVEYMAFPRLCALCEVAWSPADSREWKGFVDRLGGHLKRLDVLEVNYRPLESEEGLVVGKWKAGEQTDAFGVRVWDITPAADQAGPATVVFQYTSGGHRLDIEWIELLVNGQVALRVNQYGITGLFNRDNRYAVNIPVVPRGGKLELRANVRGDGGGDSNGDILVVRPLR